MAPSYMIGLRHIAMPPGKTGYPVPIYVRHSGGIAGPGTSFAYARGGIAPEMAGETSIPGEFAYTTPIPRGAIMPAAGGFASCGGGIGGPPQPYAFYEGMICPEIAGVTSIPGEFAYTTPVPRGAIMPAAGGIASNRGAIPGPGSPFAYARGGIAPEMAGETSIPGEFAYTTPIPRGAIMPAVGGITSYVGAIVNSIGGG